MVEEKDRNLDLPFQGHDPIMKARREGPSVDRLWLKSDRKMTPVQLIGFTILNVLFILGSLGFAQGLMSQFKDSIFIGCFMTSISLCFLYLGIRGLINVYRSL